MFLDGLPRDSHYWSARSKDVELYKLSRNSKIKRKSPPPEAYEIGPEVEVMAALFVQMQQTNHLLSQLPKGRKRGRAKRFKPVKWPMPETAAEILKRQERRAAFEHFESVIVYVPDEEWKAQQADR